MAYWRASQRPDFRFIQISTDEVFGEVGPDKKPFSELSAYAPRSSLFCVKGFLDHLVRAWYHTYQLPTLVTHCSNNFGPRQNCEKLLPKIILNAMNDEEIPIYGDEEHERLVICTDHCAGIL